MSDYQKNSQRLDQFFGVVPAAYRSIFMRHAASRNSCF